MLEKLPQQTKALILIELMSGALSAYRRRLAKEKKKFKPLPRPPLVFTIPKRVYPEQKIQNRLPQKSSLFEGMQPSLIYGKKREIAPLPQSVRDITYVLEPTTKLFDFQKLQPLVRDPTVLTIIWESEKEVVEVKRGGAIQKTKITLNQDEADKLLQKISAEVRIPLGEGFFRAVISNMIISATVVDRIVQKITITKILPR